MGPEQNLSDRGLSLPPAPQAVGAYVPTIRCGGVVYVSGQLPKTNDGGLLHVGKLGRELTLEQGQAAAAQAALNAVAALKAELGSLDRVRRIINIKVHVAGTPDFTDQHKVANASSDLIVQVFCEAGQHTRAALGAAALPLDTPVELELIAEVG